MDAHKINEVHRAICEALGFRREDVVALTIEAKQGHDTKVSVEFYLTDPLRPLRRV